MPDDKISGAGDAGSGKPEIGYKSARRLFEEIFGQAGGYEPLSGQLADSGSTGAGLEAVAGMLNYIQKSEAERASQTKRAKKAEEQYAKTEKELATLESGNRSLRQAFSQLEIQFAELRREYETLDSAKRVLESEKASGIGRAEAAEKRYAETERERAALETRALNLEAKIKPFLEAFNELQAAATKRKEAGGLGGEKPVAQPDASAGITDPKAREGYKEAGGESNIFSSQMTELDESFDTKADPTGIFSGQGQATGSGESIFAQKDPRGMTGIFDVPKIGVAAEAADEPEEEHHEFDSRIIPRPETKRKSKSGADSEKLEPKLEAGLEKIGLNAKQAPEQDAEKQEGEKVFKQPYNFTELFRAGFSGLTQTEQRKRLATTRYLEVGIFGSQQLKEDIERQQTGNPDFKVTLEYLTGFARKYIKTQHKIEASGEFPALSEQALEGGLPEQAPQPAHKRPIKSYWQEKLKAGLPEQAPHTEAKPAGKEIDYKGITGRLLEKLPLTEKIRDYLKRGDAEIVIGAFMRRAVAESRKKNPAYMPDDEELRRMLEDGLKTEYHVDSRKQPAEQPSPKQPPPKPAKKGWFRKKS